MSSFTNCLRSLFSLSGNIFGVGYSIPEHQVRMFDLLKRFMFNCRDTVKLLLCSTCLKESKWRVPGLLSSMSPKIHIIAQPSVYPAFLGLVLLLTNLSVVFVHGLQGHPRRTWTAVACPKSGPAQLADEKKTKKPSVLSSIFRSKKDTISTSPPIETPETQPEEVFWPETLLATDCDAARIMVFGYDSDVTKFFSGPVNQNTFYDHAKDLLAALNRHRCDVVC
jgi:hypothetical protein